MALTKRQSQVLTYVAEFIAANHYCPSFDEIAKSMNLASAATVHKHILALDEKGYLRRDANRSRALEVTDKYYELLRRDERRLDRYHREVKYATPLAGEIVAGQPLEAYENHESLSFDDVIRKDGVFALRVKGNSMIDDHILDGDYVVIQKTNRAQPGEIVVALVDKSETTLKRYFPEGTLVRLQPANMQMEPILLEPDRVEVQGRLIAVHRRYR